MFQLKREPHPILEPYGNGFESKAVFNPGIIKKDGIVYMLYRAVGDLSTYASDFGLAISHDNKTFKRISDQPIFTHHNEFTKGAVEDPRIVEIDGVFYITYVAVPQPVFEQGHAPEHREKPLITSGGLLTTTDFKNFVDKGIITPLNSDNKDIVLFPEKISGKYALLHRPNFWSRHGISSSEASRYNIELPFEKDKLPAKPLVWLSYSEDLITWNNHVVLYDMLVESDDKIGPGMPPLKTPEGWVVIFHHVESTSEGRIYSAKAVLLDLVRPYKVIARIPYNILTPETPYEKDAFVKNVVFPTGGFIEDDTLYVYYGAGDTSIGLATGSMSELRKEFEKYKL